MHSHVFSSSLTASCSPHCRRAAGAQTSSPCRTSATAQPWQRAESRRSAGVACSATAGLEAEQQVASLGQDLWNKTYYPSGADVNSIVKPWYTVDAEGQTLGRLAVLVANTIRGKTVPQYHPSMDMGAYVVVLNAEKVVVSGNKFETKMYRRHTGRPGSLKEETFKKLQARIPERIVEKAIRGMLPSGRIGNHLFTHLKVYKGGSHPHSAQQPMDITDKIDAKPSAAVSP